MKTNSFNETVTTLAAHREWATTPLKFTFRRSKRLGNGSEQLLSIYRDHGVIPKDSRSDNFNKASDDLSKYQKVDTGDLVVNKMKAWQGSVAISDHAGIISPAYFVYRPTLTVSMNARYLHYLLRSGLYFQHYGSISTGVRPNQWDLDPAAFERTLLLRPPTAEQAAIADYLDHETAEIDAFIADQTLFKKLVTEYFHSFLTEIYASRTLSTRRLKDFGVTKVSGVSVNGSSEPARDSEFGVLKTGSVSKGYFDASENKAVLDPAEMERLKTPVRAGHLIVNRANTPDLVGSLAPVLHDFPHLFLSDLLWQLKFKKVEPNYIYWYSKTRKFRDQISLIKVGASQTMQKIRFEDFARLEIPFMSFEDQRSILTKASEEGARVQQVARLVGQAIDLARERRAALITAAVTGQIDVTAKNKPAAEQIEDDVAQGLHREYA